MMESICNRCNTKMARMKETEDIQRSKRIVEELGIPYGGSFVCLSCYPEKKVEVK